MGLSMGLLEVSILMVGVERKSDTTNNRKKKQRLFFQYTSGLPLVYLPV